MNNSLYGSMVFPMSEDAKKLYEHLFGQDFNVLREKVEEVLVDKDEENPISKHKIVISGIEIEVITQDKNNLVEVIAKGKRSVSEVKFVAMNKSLKHILESEQVKTLISDIKYLETLSI